MPVCKRCIYDETIPNISFDEQGICNYCHVHDEMQVQYPTGAKGEKIFKKIARDIKKAGKDQKYDCVIGVSGGCDSSYLIYLAKKYGLRPLAVHFDNTWNSATATINIYKVLKKLKVDLYTHVVNNEEFNDMARSFLEASVPEIDALTDIAHITVLYEAAAKYKIKYLLDGHSFRTEGFTPLGWFYFDGKFVADIQKRFGTRPIKTFPNLWFWRFMKYLLVDRIKRVRPLYYFDYHKEKVKKFLNKEFDWKWYGGHHMENKYTVFCDNFLMPVKYGIDLRYVEFSAMVRSGQMTRSQALREIKTLPPVDKNLIIEVQKRLGLTDKRMAGIMNLPPKKSTDYKTYHGLFRALKPLFYLLYKADIVTKSFYIKYTGK